MPRRKARKVLVQWLYSDEIAPSLESNPPDCLEEKGLKDGDRAFIREYFHDIQRKKRDLDSLIKPYVERGGWKLSRMGVVDRVILRLAVYEIVHGKVDIGVAINEAVALAKLFGEKESAKFINGILGRFVKESSYALKL